MLLPSALERQIRVSGSWQINTLSLTIVGDAFDVLGKAFFQITPSVLDHFTSGSESGNFPDPSLRQPDISANATPAHNMPENTIVPENLITMSLSSGSYVYAVQDLHLEAFAFCLQDLNAPMHASKLA